MTPSTTTAMPSAAVDAALGISLGSIVSGALQAVLRLKIPDMLAGGPRHIGEIAACSGAHPDALYRVMRVLAAAGVFEEIGHAMFRLTEVGEVCRSDVPGPHHLLLWLSDALHFHAQAETLYSLRTGLPAGEKVTGLPLFDFLARQPELATVFNAAMTSSSTTIIDALLEAYDFSGIDVLVDIGGGHGRLLAAILRARPSMRGVLFDVDEVVAGAASSIAALDLSDRCRALAGDFFQSVPPGGDAYLLKHVIHDWDDDRAALILRNIACRLRGRPDTRVILIESVVRDGNAPDLAKLFDVEMLTLVRGRERSRGEFATLLRAAGFELVRVLGTSSRVSILEGRPTA